MRNYRHIILGVMASLAGVVQPVVAAEPDSPDTSALTTGELRDQIDASIERVAPLVARYLGVDSSPDVPVRFIAREDLAAVLLRDTLASMEDLIPQGTDIDMKRQTSEIEKKAATLSLVALYSSSEKAMLVMPELVKMVQDQALEAGLDQELVLDQMMAHELVHAVQDAEVGLVKLNAEAFKKAIVQDRLEAVFLNSAMIEGQATLVQLKVADSIGGDELRQWALDRIPGDGPVLNQEASAYRYGLRYCESIEREEGMAGVWRRLSDPPSSISELTAVSGQRGDPLERTFEGFELTLGPGAWTPLRRDGVAQTLGAGFGMLSPESQSTLKNGIRSASVVGRMELPTPENPGARALVISILEYESFEALQAATKPLLELVRVQAMRFTLNQDRSRSVPTQEGLRLSNGYLAYYAKMTPAMAGQTTFGLLAWGAIGNRLIIVNGVGAPSTAVEAQPLLRLIAKRINDIDRMRAEP